MAAFKWSTENIPSLSGMEAIVTGANSGIGKETAYQLALKGASVVMACRSRERAEEAIEALKARDESATLNLSFAKLDLADLESVKSFASDYQKNHQQLNILVLNAGVMGCPKGSTRQGYELQFGVNHLGHFALTGALLTVLKKTEKPRVITLSSFSAKFGKIDFRDLHADQKKYDSMGMYFQSKLANQLFAYELNKRAKAAGLDLISVCAHPGSTKTELMRTSPFIKVFAAIISMDAKQGALPVLRAAVDRSVEGGEYFGPDGFAEMRGHPVLVKFDKGVKEETAKQLWEESSQLSNQRFVF